jgi:hypothetical protein
MASVAVLATFCGAEAATGRQSVMPADIARMPSMPVVSLNTIGNPAVTTLDQPSGVVNTVVPTPTPTPTPEPEPISNCQDGGVENSKYTITMCMDDILQCINTGSLQGGLNDMFNEDVRNSVMGGMKLCQANVDKCINDVRVKCRNVYNESNDVWLDFNSRVIQPEYYNFVLRKTGLTPNQAENTCLLLDRNTFGSSFAAVSDANQVNTEYSNKVGAYNEALNGTLTKNNPQGVDVNTVGYDGNRGHYARWDATKGECLIRVAAYNKDKLITNSWLFGAVGNENPAEVWEKTGSTFTCSKELFDFDSLLNDARTAAVVAVPGGAVVGGAIGAAAGANAYKKKHDAYLEFDPCSDENYRKELGAKIYDSKQGGNLKTYAFKNVTFDNHQYKGEPIFDEKANFNNMTDQQCRDLHALQEKVVAYKSKIKECLDVAKNKQIADAIRQEVPDYSHRTLSREISVTDEKNNTMTLGVNLECGKPDGVSKQDISSFDSECKFVPLRSSADDGVLCDSKDDCIHVYQAQWQANELERILQSFEPTMKRLKDADKGKEIGKGVAIGAVTGAAAGGLATAITAFVEKSNITCKVGDGLNSVALGKAHSIDSLKDFYVKWNLHLPDNVAPTSTVTDRASWEQACGQFNSKLMDCPRVQVNLKDEKGKYTLVPSACKLSGTVCIASEPLMTSHGIK